MPVQPGSVQVTRDEQVEQYRREDRLYVPAADPFHPDYDPEFHFTWVRVIGERGAANLDHYINQSYLFARNGDKGMPTSRVGTESNPLHPNVDIKVDPLHNYICNGDLVLMKVPIRKWQEMCEANDRREARLRGVFRRQATAEGERLKAQANQAAGTDVTGPKPLMYPMEDRRKFEGDTDRKPAEGPSDVRDLSKHDQARDTELLEEQGLK